MYPERVPVGVPHTTRVLFTDADGQPADPDPGTVTVALTTSFNTPLELGEPEPTADTGVWQIVIPVTVTAALDRLRVTWEATVAGTPRSYIREISVVSHLLFDLADARRDGLIPPQRASDDELVRARTEVERDLEQACGIGLARQLAVETVRCVHDGVIPLTFRQPAEEPEPITVRAAAINDVALPALEVETLDPRDYGACYGPWTAGQRVRIAYEHGHSQPPAGARRAALALARARLVPGPQDVRTTTIQTEAGNVIAVQPPAQDRPFAIPDVDAFVARYGERRRRA